MKRWNTRSVTLEAPKMKKKEQRACFADGQVLRMSTTKRISRGELGMCLAHGYSVLPLDLLPSSFIYHKDSSLTQWLVLAVVKVVADMVLLLQATSGQVQECPVKLDRL